MKAPMSCLQHKLDDIDQDATTAPTEIRPNISAAVVNECTRINTRILNVRNLVLSITAEGFSPELLNRKGEREVEKMLQHAKKYLQSTKAQFDKFLGEYQHLLRAGCIADGFAQSYVKNAQIATKHALAEFAEQRSIVMGKFYDSLPDNKRLGKSPIFGLPDSPSIRGHLASIN